MSGLLLLAVLPLAYSLRISYLENFFLQSTCGQYNAAPPFSSISRSMNTENATREEAPWAVNIRNSATGSIRDSRLSCSGTIISRRHIVTAAHCVVGVAASGKYCCADGICKGGVGGKIIVGSTACNQQTNPVTCDSSIPEQSIRVVRAYSSKRFGRSMCNGTELLQDVAVLELEKDLEFSDRLRPACLGQQTPPAGSNITLFGYGNNDDLNFTGGGILRKHHQRVIPYDEECMEYKKTYLHGYEEKKFDEICSKDTKAMSCKGDSGSGEIWFQNNKAFLVGTLSYGVSCEPDLVPEKLMDISASTIFANPWIAAATGVDPTFQFKQDDIEILKEEYHIYE